MSMAVSSATSSPSSAIAPEILGRDAIISWFRGEFAAANAMIDALCNHLKLLKGDDHGEEYQKVFASIHQRRMNWISVLQNQKYFSIADVVIELKRVLSDRNEEKEMKQCSEVEFTFTEAESSLEEYRKSEINVFNDMEGLDSVSDYKDSETEVIEEGIETIENVQVQICDNHEECEQRASEIKTTKGFVAKEPVKGHTVNVVKGLKMYENIFRESELSKISQFINELRLAGQNGELSGETFIIFNQQLKGNRRELIQVGVPIFGSIKDDAKSSIEPIPPFLQDIIDHLVLWRLIPDSRKPNSCIINFFEEGESSQPYLKPPHLDQPICTIVLSECDMAFGRVLVSDSNGNFKGPLMLSLNQGTLLVMRGNSADMAKHVMCPSPNKRVSITFSKVRSPTRKPNPLSDSSTKAVGLLQPNVPQSCLLAAVPRWGLIHAPIVMITPPQPVPVPPKRMPRGNDGIGSGTGVFLPWTVATKKSTKHLPPRAQRRRLLSLDSSHPSKPISDPIVVTM